MFIIETYLLAIVFSVITMICWGSWPNMQKLVRPSWRFELFYWDYVMGIVLVALLFAFTLGSYGNAGRGFLPDLAQAEWEHIFSAVLGGAIFNAANILFVAAIALAGMAVAFPVGAGFGLVLGVSVNYIAAPVGNAGLLFGGVVLIATAILLSATAHRKLSRSQKKVSAKGILLTLAAGVLFGFFYRFIAGAMYADFRSPEAGKLGPYTAVVCFGIGVLLSNFIFNTLLMKKPVEGKPLRYAAYFEGNAKDHVMGLLGGIIWGGGLVLSILSAGEAGFAISFGLGQGNAMIAAIWGVFVWKEFREAPPGTSKWLYGMFLCYIAGLVCIVFAKS
ncbi:GRP family sugar transporter [Agriterribacter sp.]|uniref:GRP family sugar transporter n=1 Tax=Agriterribacter sp. TaxID=2821509 RepID=UPI002C459EC0|nr:GRP family sugar transporter [Agriterribacter sp.]HRP56291.1 GRP family sugar transporter [Agriterribacter sp.]